MSAGPDNGRTTRRGFLDLLIGSAGGVWLLSVVYPVIRYLRPLPSQGAGGPVVVPKDKLAEVDGEARFTILRAAGTRIIVLRDPQSQIHALSAVCTHEGCTVQYKAGEQLIWCACHNGKFGLDGHVISGPPPKPLTVLDVTRNAEGQVLVQPDVT